jgi:hypothetical protein
MNNEKKLKNLLKQIDLVYPTVIQIYFKGMLVMVYRNGIRETSKEYEKLDDIEKQAIDLKYNIEFYNNIS